VKRLPQKWPCVYLQRPEASEASDSPDIEGLTSHRTRRDVTLHKAWRR